ncbi:MAG: hypothetical protein K8M05_17055 [Deltaproteobacteria bacterium]|nr:hypothetical protein [Kofleriaceae bacterium]
MTRGGLIIAGLALGVIVAGVVVFVATRERDGEARAQAQEGERRGVDLERYRASYRERLERARQVVARRRRATAPRDAGVSAGARDGGVAWTQGSLARQMIDPQCILGPAELCATLADAVADCDAGDAQACLAVGQYLVDTPPRPLIAIAFFLYACKQGDEEGCTRMRESKEPMTEPCATDPYRCGWAAYKSHDAARLDEACTLGVADACSSLITTYDDSEPERARTYLERACQLGSPMSCAELGRRLTPGCVPERPLSEDGMPMYFPCYPPDAGQAAEARAIACEAGFAEACG